MIETIWIKMIDGIIPFLLVAGTGISLYKGIRQNQAFLSEREELLKRYLLFRGDRQVRLKIYGQDQKIYMDLLKNISNSWKNFKRVYDQCLVSLSQNTIKTKRILQIMTLLLLANTTRFLIQEYQTLGLNPLMIYPLARELSAYILIVLGFFLLRNQTQKYLTFKGEVMRTDPEVLFFPDSMETQEEHEELYNEFDPLEGKEAENVQENQAHDRKPAT